MERRSDSAGKLINSLLFLIDMLGVKVLLKDAEDVKKELMKKDLFDERWKIMRDGKSIIFPVKKRWKTAHQFVDVNFDERRQKENVKDSLSNTLSEQEMKSLKTSADIVGDIAIIEIDSSLENRKKEIGEAFLRLNKSVKTVVRKSGGHEGELRIQKHEFLAGEKNTITVHKENGCLLKLDIDKVYYSSRTATERLRVTRLVKPGESVLVMFSGCAPFPCIIAKNAAPKEVVGIELNPDGHKYGLENVRLNKLKNVHLICGDVNVEVPKFKTAFDRIIMPLPRTGADFLSTAFLAAKKDTIIHFYSFQKEGEFDIAENIVKEEGVKAGKKIKILRTVKAGQNAPRSFRICVDGLVE